MNSETPIQNHNSKEEYFLVLPEKSTRDNIETVANQIQEMLGTEGEVLQKYFGFKMLRVKGASDLIQNKIYPKFNFEGIQKIKSKIDMVR